MNTPDGCCSPCPTIQTINVPGSQGSAGAAGTNGINGIDAFSFLTANFNTPADTVTPITISVSSSLWMIIGERIMIGQGAGLVLANPGPGTFIVTAIPSPTTVTVTFVHATGDVGFNTTISAGAVVSGVGVSSIVLPVAIADGGTGAITKAAAQTALGLGQDPIVSSNSGLTQIITNAEVQVGTVDVTIPALGRYLIAGWITVDCDGASFANRVITFRIRNTTQNVNLATKTYHTQTLVTQDLPSADYYIQVSDATAAAADHIQLRWGCDTINSAGTYQIIAAELIATPLRKS